MENRFYKMVYIVVLYSCGPSVVFIPMAISGRQILIDLSFDQQLDFGLQLFPFPANDSLNQSLLLVQVSQIF